MKFVLLSVFILFALSYERGSLGETCDCSCSCEPEIVIQQGCGCQKEEKIDKSTRVPSTAAPSTDAAASTETMTTGTTTPIVCTGDYQLVQAIGKCILLMVQAKSFPLAGVHCQNNSGQLLIPANAAEITALSNWINVDELYWTSGNKNIMGDFVWGDNSVIQQGDFTWTVLPSANTTAIAMDSTASELSPQDNSLLDLKAVCQAV